MTPEKNMHYTLIKCFEIDGETELSNILKHSKIFYEKQWGFTGVVSNQRKMYINIKTPREFKSMLEKKLDALEKLCFEIYEDDDQYSAVGVKISTLAYSIASIEIEEIEKDS